MSAITINQDEIKMALEKAIEREVTDEELYQFIYRLQNRELPIWLEKEATRQKIKIRINEITNGTKCEQTELHPQAGAPVKEGAYI